MLMPTAPSVPAHPTAHTAARSTGPAAVVLLAIAALAVGLPIAGAISETAMGVSAHGVPWSSLGRAWPGLLTTAGVALGVGLAAAVLGWPMAWAMTTARAGLFTALLLTPLLLPQVLAYTGWGVIRSPDTWLGDHIVRAAQGGARWLPRLLDRVFAVAGMALWASPLAGAVISVGLAQTDRAVLDQLRLLTPPGPRRHLALARLHLLPLASGAVAVAAVMIGSAVPFHLAQLPTHATAIWLDLAETGPDRRAEVWLAAAPAPLLALAAAWALASTLLRAVAKRPGAAARDLGDVEAEPHDPGPRCAPEWRTEGWTRALTIALALGVWACAALVPAGLLALTLRDPSAIGRFWTLTGPAVAFSGGVAGVVALVTALVAALTGACAASPRAWPRLMAAGVTVTLFAAALTPGVMVGAATLAAWNLPGLAALRDSPAPLVLAHLTRFAALGCAAGLAIAIFEPAALRAQWVAIGADGLGDWSRAVLPRRWPAVAGTAAAAGCLSLHEIEASVMVQPPGPGNLARTLLDALHYARTDDLAAAVLNLMAIACLLAPLAPIGLRIGLTRRPGNPGRQTL